MTLPTDLDLPLKENYEDEKDYLRDIVFELQGMYENIANNVNGFIRNDTEIDQARWLPTLSGSVAGIFTYGVPRNGWSIRQGILTEVGFDIRWTATTATGDLQIDLPYKVTTSVGLPFVGAAFSGQINYNLPTHTAIVVTAVPGAYYATIHGYGQGVDPSDVQVQNAGRILGSIRYIGVEDE